MLTMLLGGLWHGASWMYLLWGAYHGALLILHKMLRNIHILPGKFVGHWLVKIANMSVMFVLIVAGFAIFRAPDLTTLASIGTSIFSNFHGSVALQFVEGYPFIILALVVALIAHYSPRGWTEQLTKAYVSSPIVLQAVVVTAVLFLVIQTRQSDLVPFLYLKY